MLVSSALEGLSPHRYEKKIRPNILKVYLTHPLIHVNMLCIHGFKTIFVFALSLLFLKPPTKCLALFAYLEADPAFFGLGTSQACLVGLV